MTKLKSGSLVFKDLCNNEWESTPLALESEQGYLCPFVSPSTSVRDAGTTDIDGEELKGIPKPRSRPLSRQEIDSKKEPASRARISRKK